MALYEIVRPWHGVNKGDVIELDKVHFALESHVKSASKGVTLAPATPEAASEPKDRKSTIQARLTELGIEYKGTLGVDKLTELLPEGELEKLFPEE